ncbi:MAG: outer membrane beta-barrel family protein, partial [Bacteroidota bacterium]
YLFFTNEGDITDNWSQTLDYLEPGTYHQIDLIYTKEYDKEGRKFTAYFRNDIWQEEESEQVGITELVPFEQSLLDLRTSSIESSRDHLLQADYETPLGENSKLEVGLRGETRIISADYSAEQDIDNVWQPISGFNNILDYYEQIGSAYFQYRYKKDAFGLQLGLRNEYTFIRVESDEAGSGDFDKSYNQLFPSASLSYQLQEGQDLQLSYSRRIRRPQFWQLNPFRGFNDPTSLFIGNPDMDPAYTNRVELNYVQRWEKLTFNPAIYASRTTDYFEVARDQEATNIFGFDSGTLLSRPINLGYEDQYGIEITMNYRPTEDITIAWDANYYGYQQRGEFGDRSFDFDFATWTTGLRLQFNLPKDISIQTQGNYRARSKTVQVLNRANYAGSLSLSKQWNDKWTLTLTTRSPVWWDMQVSRPSFVLEERGRWVGWRSMVNLQYRFEKGARSNGRRNRGSIR